MLTSIGNRELLLLLLLVLVVVLVGKGPLLRPFIICELEALDDDDDECILPPPFGGNGAPMDPLLLPLDDLLLFTCT